MGSVVSTIASDGLNWLDTAGSMVGEAIGTLDGPEDVELSDVLGSYIGESIGSLGEPRMPGLCAELCTNTFRIIAGREVNK